MPQGAFVAGPGETTWAHDGHAGCQAGLMVQTGKEAAGHKAVGSVVSGGRSTGKTLVARPPDRQGCGAGRLQSEAGGVNINEQGLPSFEGAMVGL